MDLKNLTISSIFMVPTLKIPGDKLINNGFINGYISDKNKEVNYNNAVYLLFKPKDLDYFRDFVDEERDRTSSLLDDYDYPPYVVIVYALNPRYIEDFLLIKRGKYSKTSQEFQNEFPKIKKIIKNGKYKDEIALQVQIFNKSQGLREYWENKINIDFRDDMEVWPSFEDEKEVLDINKIKQLV